MEFTFRSPDDMHVHLRQGPQLGPYARALAATFCRALVMPNTLPPVTTPEDIMAYRRSIREAAPGLTPLMTFKLTASILPEDVPTLRAAGAVAGKLYPAGVTTHAEDGVRDVREVYPVLDAMSREGLVLCVHAEDPGAFCLDRERSFIPELERAASRFPDLRIVVEHVSTAAMTRFVRTGGEKLAATVTVHHLLHTLDDMLGDKLNPHLFCKPLVQRPEDRDALQEAVLESHPRFFFGSDSAPHPRDSKECGHGAAGAYTAPVALSLLLEFFDLNGKLESIEDFSSRFGAEFYGLPLNTGTTGAVRDAWTVPDESEGAVPLGAGKTLRWKIRA